MFADRITGLDWVSEGMRLMDDQVKPSKIYGAEGQSDAGVITCKQKSVTYSAEPQSYGYFLKRFTRR